MGIGVDMIQEFSRRFLKVPTQDNRTLILQGTLTHARDTSRAKLKKGGRKGAITNHDEAHHIPQHAICIGEPPRSLAVALMKDI